MKFNFVVHSASAGKGVFFVSSVFWPVFMMNRIILNHSAF